MGRARDSSVPRFKDDYSSETERAAAAEKEAAATANAKAGVLVKRALPGYSVYASAVDKVRHRLAGTTGPHGSLLLRMCSCF